MGTKTRPPYMLLIVGWWWRRNSNTVGFVGVRKLTTNLQNSDNFVNLMALEADPFVQQLPLVEGGLQHP
ncbi:MAG: hypothetical protein L3J88_08415 [Gammaproteobacteria bacterium]|nr:hypothetical protein [Gammaproteobacteria bacterium]MCF6363351.1 hypothetical protein [Gammaproteobacteria bacterium]